MRASKEREQIEYLKTQCKTYLDLHKVSGHHWHYLEACKCLERARVIYESYWQDETDIIDFKQYLEAA